MSPECRRAACHTAVLLVSTHTGVGLRSPTPPRRGEHQRSANPFAPGGARTFPIWRRSRTGALRGIIGYHYLASEGSGYTPITDDDAALLLWRVLRPEMCSQPTTYAWRTQYLHRWMQGVGSDRHRKGGMGTERDPGQPALHDGHVNLLLMADTHVPQRARDLPEQLWRTVDDADVVVHAGDWVCVELLDALLARSDRLIGVVGNNDGPELSARLPEVATVELAGVRLAVVHETGSARGREQRCAARFPNADVLVFGHSHIPWDTVAPTGLRLLNPGSPTDRRRQPTCSWMTAEIIGGRLGGVQLHRSPLVTR